MDSRKLAAGFERQSAVAEGPGLRCASGLLALSAPLQPYTRYVACTSLVCWLVARRGGYGGAGSRRTEISTHHCCRGASKCWSRDARWSPWRISARSANSLARSGAGTGSQPRGRLRRGVDLQLRRPHLWSKSRKAERRLQHRSPCHRRCWSTWPWCETTANLRPVS